MSGLSGIVPTPSSQAFCVDVRCSEAGKRAASAALAAAVFGSAMAFIDAGAVNNALPVLQASMRATSAQAQWVVESYSLFLASLVLAGGALGDRFGRRRMYILGVTAFALASIACAASVDIDMLIVARSVQGITAAILVPASLALIGAAYDEHQRGRAIGMWSAIVTLMSAVGPMLGGFLTQALSWRYVFVINLPISVVAIGIAMLRVQESRDEAEAGQPVDWRGTALMTVGLSAVVFALIQAQMASAHYRWLAVIFGFGLAAIVAFFFLEDRVKSPLIPPYLFKIPAFLRINIQTLILYGALGGAFYYFPFELIEVKHYSPAAAGAAMAPFAVFMVLFSRWAGGLVDRFGARLPLTIGPAIAAIGVFLLSFHYNSLSYWTSIFPGIILLAIGMTITVPPLTAVAMTSVPQEHVGLASGANNAAARVAGLIAIAIFGLIMFSQFSQALSSRMIAAPISHRVQSAIESQRDRLTAIVIPQSASQAERVAARSIIEGSFDDAFRRLMLLSAGLTVLACLIGFSLPSIAPAAQRVRQAYVPAHGRIAQR